MLGLWERSVAVASSEAAFAKERALVMVTVMEAWARQLDVQPWTVRLEARGGMVTYSW